eukprot:CAMPEP_0197519194 /NCGR_PEP_ID=MMETSP1318-20131121/4458_1 /TAXON_ID=552666 /ORGANISM="Partenskyella glossopodia, Strain RCC365" /LENGTH=451 /DNA_ID=CAMNT_0043070033 /DNA_START=65 /DNA_END=1420 /DNA_ORIENTATION=-
MPAKAFTKNDKIHKGNKVNSDKKGNQLGPFELLWHEKAQMYLGIAMLAVLLPFVGTVVASGVFWDALDRGFMGRPNDGILMQLVGWIIKKTHDFNKGFVKHEADSYMVNNVIMLGVFLPLFFAYCFYSTVTHGFSLFLCYIYHVIRIGPYFMNFAYVYTLCHKEGHSRVGLFKGSGNSAINSVYNWWIGLFYGVLPSSFAYGHSINHHKYNNGPDDVVSTSDKARDSPWNFFSYLPRWVGYAINVTTTLQFYSEGNTRIATKMVTGSMWWLGFFGLTYSIHPLFAISYILYPLAENIVLLACIQWCWHAFLDPNDPENEYVGSITIFDGPINVLNEDYHVVHHQYPGAHWTKNPQLYDKHFQKGEYEQHVATVFRNTHAFEMFFLIILAEYDQMAEKFIDLTGKLSHEQKKDLIKQRLRTCWWGPRANLNIKLQRKEVGNFDLGRSFVESK